VDIGAIDRARILLGWTRRDLGLKACVDEGTLCDLFAGRRTPTFGTQRAVCRALEMPLEVAIVFQGSDKPPAVHNAEA
jgi:transcriptional regulator with XRE-family HTH domain